MRESASNHGSRWPARVSGIAIAASLAPLLWAVCSYPIDKGSVFVGPITLFGGLSIVAWMLTSAVGMTVMLWTQFKRPALRRSAWLALLAGEFFYVAGFMVTGAIVGRVLDGHWRTDVLSLLILSGSVLGCAWSTRETFR